MARTACLQALLLLQLAGQWLGLIGAPPLPGSSLPDAAAVLHSARGGPRTSTSSDPAAVVDAGDVHVDGLSQHGVAQAGGPIGGPAMVPPPPAFELAVQLAAAALTCTRGPGPALGAARLALHAHTAALLTQPPFPLSLDDLVLRGHERGSCMSLFLPQPPANGEAKKLMSRVGVQLVWDGG